MSGFPSIMCPVDFSDHSKRALQYAARIAEHFGARLTILHVIDLTLVGSATIGQPDLMPETRADLSAFLASAVPDIDTRVKTRRLLVSVGSPVPQILHAARQEQADLIVMGTHGLGGYRKLFFGSTTERVLRRTDVPVLAVPLIDGDVLVPADRLAASLDTILAPVDFSDASTHAAHIAVGLATALRARLVLVHAVPPVHAFGRWGDRAKTRDLANVAGAREWMDALVKSLDLPTPPLTDVRVGAPAEVIARVADEQHARLIVMGLHGAGRLLGPGPGSVTYRVLCLAPAPVLALPEATPSTKPLSERSTADSIGLN